MIHHQRYLLILFFSLFLLSFHSNSQTIEELEKELALLEAELDSVSILGFIDSLININAPASTFSIRTGYSNQVFANGQDLGIQQFGINNSLSYFNKSGIYVNYSGFYNSGTAPKYYLSTIGLGYFGKINKQFDFSVNIERLFFHDNTSNSLSNSLNGSLGYKPKNSNLLFNISYSFLYGSETAHQIIPTVSYLKSFKKPWFFKSIDISPTFGLFWANPNIVTSNFDEEFLRETWLINQLSDNELNALFSIRGPRGNTLYNAVINSFEARENNNFILLNSSLSIPINFQITNKFSFGTTFTYLLANDLTLGVVDRNERRIRSLGSLSERLENTLNGLNDNIIFPSTNNSSFFSINFTYNFSVPKKDL